MANGKDFSACFHLFIIMYCRSLTQQICDDEYQKLYCVYPRISVL